MNISLMGTTRRHNNLLAEFYRKLADFLDELIINKKALLFLEQISLCYYGEPKEPDLVKLIDVNSPSFDEKDINYFYTVQPDLMLFKENDYVANDLETRYAGSPDLILEVWSKANDELYRNFKKNLYKSSNTTEHWYIAQDSNEIECWIGDMQLPYQNLKNELVTQKKIKIDLRYLSL